MLRKSICFLLLLCILCFKRSAAQDWVKKINDPTVNFYDIQTSFNKYWKKEERREKFKSFFKTKNKTEEENEGFIIYKRWEDYVAPRVYPSGDRSLLNNTAKEIEKIITNHSYRSSMLAGGNWTPLGAFTVPTNGGGAGRLSCIRFHPTNSNIIYTGAPAGGLWKSTNAGTTWSTNTDALPTLGVNDVAVDPTSTNVMYIATGDVDASDTHGVGILKSTDYGVTWNITGLNWLVSQGRNIARVIINPADHNMIFAGTTAGVYRSLDAGITWTKVLAANNIKDMELKPGDPSTIYATSTTNFYKSTNTGASFSIVSAGLPFATTVSRLAIAVTPADPNYVYLLYSDATSNGFKALYLSTDSGVTFNMQSNYPNLLGWASDGSDTGGQGWYTLSIAVSPVNKYEVIVGGVNVWKSDDGGIDWYLNAHWYGGGAPYVHADIHDLIYRPDGSAYFAACDGGIFQTTDGGASWNDLSGGLQIGQMYRLGNSATNPNMVMQGWQDNGCNLYNGGTWNHALGGDGMETFIDWSDPGYVYAESQNGGLNRSADGGASFSGIVNNISETGAWLTPWVQDPVAPQTIYAGFENVWKSTNRGDVWTQISTFGSGDLTCLAVAQSNPQYIYASNGAIIFKTTDGGATWSNVSVPFAGSNAITYIAISTTDPNKIWITRSGYNAVNKVFKSIDGGTTWINLSASLPNIPINCVVNQTGTSDGVYIGTDLGVYYMDNTLSSWMPYSNGLPNVVVDELEIQYSTSKLRAATFGRGLWETKIYDPSSPMPFANFSADSLSGCPGITVQFSDSTTHSPTAWQWRFPGGIPATSTLQNPVITYNIPGAYNNVTLVVTNAIGTDSVTKYSYIAVSPQIQPVISLNANDSICYGHSVLLTSSSGNSYKWHPDNQTSQAINVDNTGTYSVTTIDVFGCATTSLPESIYVFPVPATPVITVSNDTLYSSSASGNQWYLNGTAIPGATNPFYEMPASTFGGSYTVKVTNSPIGCSSTSSVFVGIDEATAIGISYSVYPNPSNGAMTVVLESTSVDDELIEITDVTGRVIYDKKYKSFSGRSESIIDLSAKAKGAYLLSIKNSKGSTAKKVIVY